MKRVEWRSCASKVRYRSQDEARRAATKATSIRGTRLRVYCCGLCGGGFHLTKAGR